MASGQCYRVFLSLLKVLLDRAGLMASSFVLFAFIFILSYFFSGGGAATEGEGEGETES